MKIFDYINLGIGAICFAYIIIIVYKDLKAFRKRLKNMEKEFRDKYKL